ncbi:MAG: hypothetical protein KatS3mg058_2266 [Roseiflexus sp.]|nr:MAG: hypothetical protein KatS3mg058_2266 [Roseiflexus sp.]
MLHVFGGVRGAPWVHIQRTTDMRPVGALAARVEGAGGGRGGRWRRAWGRWAWGALAARPCFLSIFHLHPLHLQLATSLIATQGLRPESPP